MDHQTANRNTLTINNIRISEAITGDEDAPPVVMLHGWGAHIDLVWPLAKVLAPQGYRVYAFDLPGFGESDPPPEAWSVHDYVRFVLAYLDHHGLERVYLFGHSFGGRLGLILGAEHPERIMKVVLADAAGIRTPVPIASRVRLGLYKGVRDGLKSIGMGRLSDRLRNWYNDRYGSTDFQAASGVMRETFVRVVGEDLRDYARRVTVPTLLLWGDQDTDTPLWQGRLLEKLIPDAGLVVYVGAGHYSYLERLTQSARVMRELYRSS